MFHLLSNYKKYPILFYVITVENWIMMLHKVAASLGCAKLALCNEGLL